MHRSEQAAAEAAKPEIKAPNGKLREIGALATAAVALLAASPEKSEARAYEQTSATAVPVLSEKGSQSESAKAPARLRRVTELPGWGIEVSRQEAERLQESTLKLEARHKEMGNFEECTFVKVKMPSGNAGGITAAHCFSELTGRKYGLLKPGVNGYPDTLEARDILIPDSAYEYLVLDPKAPGGNPIGKVKGISVKPGKDLALLQIEPWEASDGVSRSFNDIPSLTYKSAFKKPLEGQAVAYASVPTSSGKTLIGGKGVYVGRMPFYNNVENVTQIVDVVAQTPKSHDKNAGSPGASGSSVALKGGQFFHALSGRESLGYGVTKNSVNADKPSALYYWNMAQKLLRVRLPTNKFSELSFYPVQTPNDVPELEAGFGKHVAMVPPRK